MIKEAQGNYQEEGKRNNEEREQKLRRQREEFEEKHNFVLS